MFKDVKTGIRLMRYSLQYKTILGLLIFFMIFGIAMELMAGTEGTNLGGVYMAISGVYIYQMVITNSASAVVAASPARKALQTYVPTILSGIATLIFYTVFAVLRLVRINRTPEIMASPELKAGQISSFVIIALLIFVMFLYNAIAYKMYLAALIIFIPSIFIICSSSGTFDLSKFIPTLGTPVTALIISYALIFAGMLGGYLLSLLLYRKPLDAKTYKAAIARAGK